MENTPKQYRVIALSVGDDFNQIHKSQDIVQADFWKEEGRAEELLAQGFLEEYTPDPVETGDPYTLTAEDLVRNPELAEAGLKEGETIYLPREGFVPDPKAVYASMTVKDLKALLDEKQIAYAANAKKDDLIALLTNEPA